MTVGGKWSFELIHPKAPAVTRLAEEDWDRSGEPAIAVAVR